MTERDEIFKTLEDLYRERHQQMTSDDLRAELARITTNLMQHLTVRGLNELLNNERAANVEHLLEDVRMYAWKAAVCVPVQHLAELSEDGDVTVRLWGEIDRRMHRATIVIDQDGAAHATYHIDGLQDAEHGGTDWRGLVIAACRWLEANRHKSAVIRLGRLAEGDNHGE